MLNRFKSAVGSIMDDMGVNKQLKQLHTAITKGNEEAAVQLYTSDSGSTSSSSSSGSNKLQKGKNGSLNQTLDLNDPFKLRGLGDETPMNLVSQSCMVKLCKIFLENGGNPNSLNSSHQSCIHSLCSRPEAPMQRDELLKIFLDWESAGMTGEQASLNQVDLEGNTAVHLAAMNGLLGCVIRLVKAGAIISLVNNSQRTCCELADVGGHADLASMLELALIFQPIDADMAAFDETNTRANSSQLPTYMLDSASKTEGEMTLYMDSLIRRTADVIRETEARTETLLKLTNWNSDELVTACQTHEGKRSIFARSNLHLEEAPPLPLDDRVPPSARDNAKERDGDLVGAPEHVAKVSGSPSTQRVDGNEGDEVLIAGVSVVQKTTGDENLYALKEAEEQAVSNLKSAVGESREPTGQKQCEICMVSMRGDVGSYKDFMQRLRARARACVPIDSGSGSPPLTPTTVRLTEEEQDLTLTCESGQHSYCLSCWSQHVVAKVSDHGLDCLSCPAFKCGECAPLQWALVLLQSTNNTRAGVMEVPMAGPDQAQRPEQEEQNTLYAGMMHSRTRRFVDTFHASHYCPHTGCDKVVLVNLEQSRRSDLNFGSEALPQTVFCSAGHASCLACQEEGHAPCSCDEYRRWKTAVAKQMQVLGDSDGKPTGAEEVATKLWFNANTKKCPRCGATIEKDEGCNHMTCGNCRHDFCWMCMRPWREHTNATGGYFVCNRFMGDDDKAAGTGSASADHDDVLGLTTRARGQPGSSSEEAKRQAAANQKMARFIHFFTRFNGHSDSMNKEISIRNATFSRILGNAERTAHGDLAWLRAESPDENITPTLPREIPHSRVIGADSSVGSAPTPPPPTSSASSQEGHSPAPLTATTEGGSTNPLLSSSPPASMAEPATPPPAMKGGMPRHTPQRRRSNSGSIFSRSRLGSGSASGETPLGVFRSLFGGSGSKGGGAGSRDEEGAVKVEGLDAIRREEEEGYRQQYSENTSSLLFLRDAFEELSRARIFLKGSYAYGYFKFQDSNVRATRATMFVRHQILAMEKCFTDAQGELEFSVELLSDVVARKRLRASQHDIRRSALAARAKRIEMEDMLLGMEVAEATERAVREATIRENKEERSVLLAKKRSSLTTGASAKADLRGLAALSIDESLQRVAAASRRHQARTRASAGGPASRRASSARRGPPEAPVGLYEGFDPADAGDDASENVLRELISDLRAQQRAAGITGRNADVDQFEALLQSYDLENLPMAPTASEARGGGINAFQRAEPASARRRASRKTKKRTVSDPTRPSSSSGSSTGEGSSGSFGAAAAATPASPRSIPGKNLPSTSAHSSPVRLVNSGDLSDSSAEVSDSASSRFEEDEEEGSDAEATRQQAELRQRHLERTSTSTSTSTSGSRNSSGRVGSMFQGTQEEQLRRLEHEQAEEEAQGALEEGEEEGDYELHRAILASLNLGPGEYGTLPPSGAETSTDGSASLQEQGPAQDTSTGREPPTDIDTEARVASLVEMMGCSEEAALQALTRSGFRVEAALDRLLSGG